MRLQRVDQSHPSRTSLQTLKRFQVTTDVTAERVLQDGQKLQHMATATPDVVRPNKLRARMVSARSQRDLIYDVATASRQAVVAARFLIDAWRGGWGDSLEVCLSRESRCGHWPFHPGFFTVSEECRKHQTRRSASCQSAMCGHSNARSRCAA